MNTIAGKWYRDNSLRVVKVVCPDRGGSRAEVIYSLYRLVRRWRTGEPEEFVYLREGYCSIRHWRRWAKGAREWTGGSVTDLCKQKEKT